MIIAISGKKQSGKDTVGKIIQYLTSNYYKSELSKRNRILSSEEIDFKNFFITNKQFNWEIKKFANKLKDIVALLIGCTKEQLEEEEFKNTKLGEEWWFYKDKDGEIIKGYLDVTEKELEKWKKSHFHYYLVKPTVRHLLQFLGTDLFRVNLHPNVWVNSLMNEYQVLPKITKKQESHGTLYCYYVTCNYCGKKFNSKDKRAFICDTCFDNQIDNYPNWIITDSRFPNELKAVEDKNGIAIRINRHKQCATCETYFIKGKECPKCGSGNWVYGNIADHISETALDDAKFDYVIDNNGTIEELIEKVKEILIKEKLL